MVVGDSERVCVCVFLFDLSDVMSGIKAHITSGGGAA